MTYKMTSDWGGSGITLNRSVAEKLGKTPGKLLEQLELRRRSIQNQT